MRRRLARAAAVVLLVLCAVFAGHLLFSALAAYSAQNYLMSDYGVYTNTIYNLAHGNGFKFMVDHSYLKTHLSFSMILLTPVFWIFRTPTLLIFVQWLFLIGGCTICLRIMQKRNVPRPAIAAVLFFMCAYHMTQSVMLSEFHGVSAYYLLLPWLAHELMFRKKLAVIPLLITLGLREDAGLMLLPLILYFSVKDKWKAGYILAGASLLYSVVAVTILYPLISGESIWAVRAAEASSQGIGASIDRTGLTLRAQALFWVALPLTAAAFNAGRKSGALLTFPAVALFIAMLSGMERQHSLTFHYPAPVIAMLSCAMAVSISTTLKTRKAIAIASLVLVTLVSHAINGFFLGGSASHPVYKHISPHGKALTITAKETATEGTLVADKRLAPYFCLRENILTMDYFDASTHSADMVVCDVHELQSDRLQWVHEGLDNGTYSLKAGAFPYMLLEKNSETGSNIQMPDAVLAAALMPSHGGSVVYDDAEGLLRYWNGLDRKAPITLAYGKAVRLEPGNYIAKFNISVLPEESEKGMGTVSVHFKNRPEAIAEKAIATQTEGKHAPELDIPFSIDKQSDIEPRITGGGVELWAKSISFRRLE